MHVGDVCQPNEISGMEGTRHVIFWQPIKLCRTGAMAENFPPYRRSYWLSVPRITSQRWSIPPPWDGYNGIVIQ